MINPFVKFLKKEQNKFIEMNEWAQCSVNNKTKYMSQTEKENTTK